VPDLWIHQRRQSEWIGERGSSFLNGDMGTGKTAAVIDAVRSARKVLVVCPIAVGAAWVKQFGLWDSHREACLVVDGSTAKRAERIKKLAKSSDDFAVIVNYDGVWRGDLGKAVSGIKWDAIVLDESHRIKSPSGRASRWLARLGQSQPEAKRICMSGTPTPNSPLDWWAQFRFLDETILGKSYTGFRARIARTHPRFPGFVLEYRPDAIEAMTKRIDPHVFRVTADEVLTLPDAIHVDIPVSLSPKTMTYYKSLEQEMVATLESGETVTAANKLVMLTRLQQATGGFATSDDGETVEIGTEKPDAMRDWLEDLPATEPVVIFCRFINDIDAVCKSLETLGRSYSVLKGGKNQLAQWQQGDTVALVVQTQAGGCGIDATRACYAAYYSQTHSLGDYEQSLARLRRPGQTRPVRYYHFIAQGTVDETIYEALQSKRDVVDSVLTVLTRRSLV
jgi:SNF2 family DNA or RNA helicase